MIDEMGLVARLRQSAELFEAVRAMHAGAEGADAEPHWSSQGEAETAHDLASEAAAAIERLVAAASTYFERYCKDEVDDVENCVCGEQQHRDAIALRDAIAALGDTTHRLPVRRPYGRLRSWRAGRYGDGVEAVKHDNDNEPGPLGRIYTLGEVAGYMRTTRSAVSRVARRTGHCSIFGRTMLFSESDLLAIWDDTRCPSQSSHEEKSGISGAPLLSASEANLSTRAQAFLTKGKRKSSASGRKAA